MVAERVAPLDPIPPDREILVQMLVFCLIPTILY